MLVPFRRADLLHPLDSVKAVSQATACAACVSTRNGKLEAEIAALLDERGVKTDLDRPWTRGTVHQVLTNEKYIGNNVYNRPF